MPFSKRLISLRKQNHLTQKQLATAVDLSELAIQNYESQRRKPSYDALVSIANYFDVPLDYLAGRGFFEKWDDIMHFKDEILHIIKKENPNLKKINLDDLFSEIMMIRLFPVLFQKIECSVESNDIVLYPYIPLSDLTDILESLKP